jgi:hypothetical protein
MEDSKSTISNLPFHKATFCAKNFKFEVMQAQRLIFIPRFQPIMTVYLLPMTDIYSLIRQPLSSNSFYIVEKVCSELCHDHLPRSAASLTSFDAWVCNT